MLCSAIVKRALRNIGGMDAAGEPGAAEADRAMEALNTLIFSMFGNEIGPTLDEVTLTAALTGVYGASYQCVLGAAATLTLPANPQDGWIVGFQDQVGNFNTYNLTVNPNSRRISTGTVGAYQSTNRAFSVNGAGHRFFYRGDAGWTEVQTLTLTDTPYFPEDLHGNLADILAFVLKSEYTGASEVLEPTLAAKATDGRNRFIMRYGTARARAAANLPRI